MSSGVLDSYRRAGEGLKANDRTGNLNLDAVSPLYASWEEPTALRAS